MKAISALSGHEAILSLTDASFDAAVADPSTPLLVEFVASWCSTCRAMAPVVEDLARSFAGRVRIGTLDVDAYPDLADQFGIRGLPTLLFFHEGAVVGQATGFVPKHVLAAHLSALAPPVKTPAL